jgi:MYXO-CTERM domain-containing protein
LYQQEIRLLEEMQEAHSKGRHRLAVEEVPTPLVYHSDPNDPIFAQRVRLSEIGLTTLKNAWWAVLGLGAVGGYAVHRRRRVRQGGLADTPKIVQTTPGGRSGADDEISWA